ncbi:hypothetical protein PVAND_002832 [Polypedilum vanderplanki]|uniref:apyrase n=1 Tax=Polypedilum vanderplanki TaxID=319348 RepID=A0A9J6BTB8_POLVA|nr:hypothetical protein PVAND_002832 [Polypedilum vanderplanki]
MRFVYILLSFVALLSVITIAVVLIVVFTEINEENKPETGELFELSIIHINDFHARFDETNEKSMPCVDGEVCIGGYARLATVVHFLKSQRKNAIFLNAGDNFQGTFWYNLLRYNVTTHFLNLLPADAITIGNHEFTHRVEGMIPFLKLITSPVVIANIDDRYQPNIQNLYKKSIVIERSGRKIGIIGVIFRETAEVANTDNLKFTNEIDAIRNESTKLRQIDGVNIIIVLSHCGLVRDKEIALETGDFVDVIVGGHSHTFLYTSKDTRYPGPDQAVGPYPIVVTPKSGRDRKVLIVQASAFTKYVGDLRVYFNQAGHVRFYDGNPIFLSNNIKQDANVLEELKPWRDEVIRRGQRIIGSTNVDLFHDICRHDECALGSFATDAFMYETQLAFPHVQINAAIIQAAGMRNGFRISNISFSDIVAFMPFENTLDIMELRGEVIVDMFEHSVSRSFVEHEFIGIHMMQVSGFRISFNVTRPVGQRVKSLEIKTTQSDYEIVHPNKYYTLIIPSFIAAGGDGFTMLKLKRKNHRVGLLDIDIMESYIARKSPITHQIDGRINMLI